MADAEPPPKRHKMGNARAMDDGEAVKLFRNLLCFKTVSQSGHIKQTPSDKLCPNQACVEFLREHCQRIGLKTLIVRGPDPKGLKPILIATWEGINPKLPSLMLNSHYDVVPIVASEWKVPAFEGLLLFPGSFPENDHTPPPSELPPAPHSHAKPCPVPAASIAAEMVSPASATPHAEANGITDNGDGGGQHSGGRVYGRGAQDMKCVCAMYIAAVARLSAQGFRPTCNVHLTFVPDEETGGAGMAYLINTKAVWERLNVGCALDEGLCNTRPDAYTMFYGERTPWWIQVEAKGPTGHGSRFIPGTATHTLHAWTQRALQFRKAQEQRLHAPDLKSGCGHAKCKKLGDVATINLTVLRAGVTTDHGQTFAINVIPTNAFACFDVRIPLDTPHAELEAMFDRWCREACAQSGAPAGSLSWRFVPYGGAPLKHHYKTTLQASNKWWIAFQRALQSTGMALQTEVFPAGTDSRFLRALDIPAFGFSPINSDPILLHEHNEYLSTAVYLKGIATYQAVIRSLTAVGGARAGNV